MQKTGIVTAAFFMFSAVALGAFGAHGLKNLLTASQLEVFKTGVFYQVIHALGIFVVLILRGIYQLKPLKYSIIFFTFGIIFFSGSLYLLATQNILGLSLSFLGPITPIGGLFFILGWLWLGVTALKAKNV